MLTCIIRYEIEPYQREEFAAYARTWGRAIPECGADLIGYFAPVEGTTTTAFGIYNIADLAAYQDYRARLAAHPLGRENYAFAAERRFIRCEDRAFYRNESGGRT